MKKTILVTGATDGIGLETAKMLATMGHHVLLHGRNPKKLKAVEETLCAIPGNGGFESYLVDLSDLTQVEGFVKRLIERNGTLDVLINNAGVFKTSNEITQAGLDVRFAVNTIAPYLLTKRLMSILGTSGRVINLSSAAQSPVNPAALTGHIRLSPMEAYSQSKLALTMWSRSMALSQGSNGPIIIAVNPGSMLGSKMVKEAFGVAGGDIRIGADILTRTALDPEFKDASGKYFDNDAGQFGAPHPDALNSQKSEAIVGVIESLLAGKS